MPTIKKTVGQITLKVITDVKSTTYYYLLQSSMAPAPSTPTTNPPGSGWSTTEPEFFAYIPTQDTSVFPGKDYYTRSGSAGDYTYTIVSNPTGNPSTNSYYEKIYGDTRSLYVTVQTLYTDNTFEYSQPSLSSSYEAAKEAYNRAKTALDLAGDTKQYFWEQPSSYSAAIPAGIYVTHIPQSQFKASGGPTQGNILIQDTGLTIRNGAISLASLTGSALKFYDGNGNNNSNIIASFGAEIILGKQQSKRIKLNSTSFEMIGLNNVSESSYFSIKDLRNEDDEIILNYVGDGTQTVFKVHDNSLIDLASIIEVEINNVYVDNWSIGDDYKTIVFTSPPSNNTEIKVHFTITDDQWCKAFTFGKRAVIEGGNKGIGLNSIVLGRLCEASAYSSISMGEATVASGANAIAMGYMTQAKEPFSIAMGYHTITSCSQQLVIGKFNNHSQNTDACFVIGNGTSNNNRSNLFVIDGNGNLKIKDGFKIINDSNNYIQLTSFGMDIFKKRESNFYKVASFSDTVRIGEENGFHLIVADSTIEFKNGNETLSYLALDKFFFINGEVSSSLFFPKYSLREGKDGKFIIGRR